MPNASDFNLPQNILQLINDPNSGVKTQVRYINDDPKGWQVKVWDENDNLIHTCPHPCTLR